MMKSVLLTSRPSACTSERYTTQAPSSAQIPLSNMVHKQQPPQVDDAGIEGTAEVFQLLLSESCLAPKPQASANDRTSFAASHQDNDGCDDWKEVD